MDKTTVDEMLMKIIKPDLDDIEARFYAGQRLENQDVNTLLLKSQYNHINHLDEKLNQVTDSVVSLEGKFVGLEGKFVGLEGKFDKLESRFDRLEDRFEHLEEKVDIRFTGIEKNMDTKFIAFEQSIKLEISEVMNKNMRWSIGLISLLVVALKLADTFAKQL
ncbi:MAG: putative nuclease with TOPRIM domain [Phenylobacterium sp.]|jgi:predicted nuclease with TOPRIM domain